MNPEITQQPKNKEQTPTEQLRDAVRSGDNAKALQLIDKFLAFVNMLGEQAGQQHAQKVVQNFMSNRQRQVFTAIASQAAAEGRKIDLDLVWEDSEAIANYEPKRG